MASPVNKNCVKCSKSVGQVLCGGCERWFCIKHLNEHRQQLGLRMDELTLEHDQLRQYLCHSDDDREHPLITRIDQWELRSIEKIKHVADNVRHELRQIIDRSKRRLEESLNHITDNMQTNRQTEEFTEIDLLRWTSQLKRLRDSFDKPPMLEIKQVDEEASSTHLPLIRLQVIPKNNVPEQITSEAQWLKNGRTIIGGCGQGDTLNQLNCPFGLDIDDDETLIIADTDNHRVMRWKLHETQGEILTGFRGQGNQTDQLDHPMAVLIDRMNDCLIIDDWGNRRVMRWSLDKQKPNVTRGEVIVSNIKSFGLALDNEGRVYVSDYERHEVRRYGPRDRREGVVVAGGNGHGNALNQLNCPRNIFVDEHQSIYVSDKDNHRVMKWTTNAIQGMVVAGGRGQGKDVGQLSCPCGIFVDRTGAVYIADQFNDRLMRWSKDSRQGIVIVGGNGQGSHNDQLFRLTSFSFDDDGNLYVVDRNNHRIQRFDLDFISKKDMSCNLDERK